ncbi:uncharacterized protein LOC114857948 isoform X2 [Betta splendens]|uniref:Uncharacterized protein LOC114857948 isoform X2 n=1 Tax=Betta splendens TaxID=158456 RepID=A0A6P7MUV0_BETSP|nr:uncharacterized protein LOC114857948 isoform X2 [Betta splendens]
MDSGTTAAAGDSTLNRESICRQISVTTSTLKELLEVLKEEFKKSALVSNAVLGLILIGVEKAVEVQFACPCHPKQNEWFSLAYLLLPGFFASVLMLVIQGFDKFRQREEMVNLLLFGLVPATMWLILVLLDGQYYVCGKTTWKGKFAIIDKADPQRWCEPDCTNSTSYNERLSKTRQWYFHSQAFGLLVFFICTGLLIAYGVYKCPFNGNQPTNQARGGTNTGNAVELTPISQHTHT